MRVLIAVMTVAALVVLGVSTTPDDLPTDSTAGYVPEPVAPAAPEQETRLSASLPNGTEFLVIVAPSVADDWLRSTGTIVMDIAGLPVSVGDLSIRNQANTEYSYEPGHLRIPAAGYLVEIDFHDHVLDALGPDAEAIITSSIRGTSEYGFPVLHLDDPFSWGTDDRSPAAMSTRFSSFEVRRGCGDLAVACSPEGSLQLIWRVPEVVSAPPLSFPKVRIFKLVP